MRTATIAATRDLGGPLTAICAPSESAVVVTSARGTATELALQIRAAEVEEALQALQIRRAGSTSCRQSKGPPRALSAPQHPQRQSLIKMCTLKNSSNWVLAVENENENEARCA